MSNIAIRAENLGKMYRIGGKQERYSTLRDTLVDAIIGPMRRMRRLVRGQSANDLAEEIWALADVSLEVQHGEAIGIIGRNGAGKSTLLKVLSRITEPTLGRADIYGRVGALLEVGTGFHPELTGRENIYLNGAILGMRRKEIDRRFDEIVDFSGVEKFIDTPVKHYSSGMGLRLGFAVASHLEPEILVVDEVLAVGDAEFQKKCLSKMSDVTGSGRTVLFVSHNMAAIQSMCQRGIWLDHGRVVEVGPVEQVVADYLSKAVVARLDQIWDDQTQAPGNDRVRLHRARVKPIEGDTKDPISMVTSILLEFDYWNLKPNTMLNVSIHVETADGITVFNTAPVHEKNWFGKAHPKGLFRSSFTIPGYLLNSGTYRVMALFVEDQYYAICRLDDILTFEVTEDPAVRGASTWFGKWPGVVHPYFEWTTDLIESS